MTPPDERQEHISADPEPESVDLRGAREGLAQRAEVEVAVRLASPPGEGTAERIEDSLRELGIELLDLRMLSAQPTESIYDLTFQASSEMLAAQVLVELGNTGTVQSTSFSAVP